MSSSLCRRRPQSFPPRRLGVRHNFSAVAATAEERRIAADDRFWDFWSDWTRAFQREGIESVRQLLRDHAPNIPLYSRYMDEVKETLRRIDKGQ